MPFRRAIFSIAVLLLASAPLALAQGTYTQIDVPGATWTSCWGIDTAGDISGIYSDPSGVVHGFLLSGGTYTTIDYPGTSDTELFGINDEGQIVGYNGSYVGFVYNVQTQAFTEVSYPNAVWTVPTAINNAGDIAGFYALLNKSPIGFELKGSTYTRILPPGTSNIYVWGITTSGEVVGYATGKQTNKLFINGSGSAIVGGYAPSGIGDGFLYQDFLFKPGKYEAILRSTGGNPAAFGINGSGNAIVGEYVPLGISGIEDGFLYQGTTLQPLSFPGAYVTSASSINAAGEVVGTFNSGSEHGFIWTPPADAAKK
jgi:uncharacterized membrane protein